MRTVILFIFVIFDSLALVSCVSKKPTQPVVIENTREVIKTIKDTVYHVEADSSYYYAYINCVNGKPILKTTSETENKSVAGKTLKKPNVVLNGNNLKVECKKEAQELFKQWRETYIKEHEQKPVYVPQIVYRDKPFTTWQKVQLWFGRIFLGLLVLFVITGILRWKGVV